MPHPHCPHCLNCPRFPYRQTALQWQKKTSPKCFQAMQGLRQQLLKEEQKEKIHGLHLHLHLRLHLHLHPYPYPYPYLGLCRYRLPLLPPARSRLAQCRNFATRRRAAKCCCRCR